MKYRDVVGLSLDEKKRKLKELRDDLFQSKIKNKLGQVANPTSIRFLRRDIARIFTSLAAPKKD